MSEVGWRIVLVGGVTLAALAAARLATRRRRAHLERRTIDTTGLEGRVVLFSSSRCPSCDRVRLLLEDAGVTFEEIRFEDRPDAHRAAGVEAVPLLVLRDGGGAVTAQVAGAPTPRRLHRSLRHAGVIDV